MPSSSHIFTFLTLFALLNAQGSLIRVYLNKYPPSTSQYTEQFSSSHMPNSIRDPSIPDTHFIADLAIGSQYQPFHLAIQTSVNCLVVGGPQSIFSNKFDCKDSSTCQMNASNTTILLGNSYRANGSLARDQFLVQSQTILNQSIFVIDTSQGLQYPDFDGILGLGFDQEDGGYHVHILEALKQNDLIQNESFSIFLGTREGQRAGCLILGGYDSRLNSSEFKYMNLSSEDSWSVNVEKVSIGATEIEIPEDSKAYFESGTTGFIFPEKLAAAFKEGLHSVATCSSVDDRIVCDCSHEETFPTLNFSFKGTDISLSPEDYFVKREGICSVSIASGPSNSSTLILGDVFMMKYYAHFDSDNKRVGLALADQEAFLEISAEFEWMKYVIIFCVGCLILALIGYLAYLKIISKPREPEEDEYIESKADKEDIEA